MKHIRKEKRAELVRQTAVIAAVCLIAIAGPILLERQISLGILEIPHGLEAGETAPRDIYAEQEIYYIDITETRKLREEAAAAVQPVFHLSQTTAFEVTGLHQDLARQLREGKSSEEIYAAFSHLLSRTQASSLGALDEPQRELVIQLTDEYLRYFLRTGVFMPREFEVIDDPVSIDVRGLDRGEADRLVRQPIVRFYRTDDIDEVLLDYTRQAGIPEELEPVISDLTASLIRPNILYDDVATRKRMEEAQQQVAPVSRKIEQGEIIIKEGFLVTDEALHQLREIRQQLYTKPPLTLLSQSIFTMLLFALFFTSIYLALPDTFRKGQYMQIVIRFVLIFTLYLNSSTYFFFQYQVETNIFFYPVALFSMLAVTLLGNFQIAVLIPVFLASLYGTMPGSTFFEVIFLLVIGILGILFVRKPDRRIDMIIGTGKLLLTYVGIALVYVFHRSIPLSDAAGILGSAAVNAAATGAMVIIMIPIFEHLWNLPTVFRLKELSDTSNPVLRRMINVARGTYSHSVSVAELVDSVSEEVGANKLLAKVGALYHDIGKIDQPEYFIENQTGSNKHDDLKPSMSAAVIKTHVKIGIEKAKQLKLPREVLDIISEHHGSDVINYFYLEAIKASRKGEKINQKDFSYHGIPPRTKEAALVMIADSVDAAVRTLKQPTSKKIEKMIWQIIMEKIERRQLSSCDLSMQDLETVRSRFLVILTGRFHTRISYPAQQKRRDGGGITH